MNTLSTCPRCGQPFHCGAYEPGPCACACLRLTEATRAMLRERYESCLCITCLVELNDPQQARTADDRPIQA